MLLNLNIVINYKLIHFFLSILHNTQLIMRNFLLLLILPTLILTSCSKSSDPTPEEKPTTLTGTKWESFAFKGSTGVDYHDRLVFISATQVEYFTTYEKPDILTAKGKSTLSYTISGNDVRIYGTQKSAITLEETEKVDYTLKYYTEKGTAKAMLNGNGSYYTPY